MNDTKENILVVEDDMQIRNFICYSVRNEGYNCKIAVQVHRPSTQFSTNL